MNNIAELERRITAALERIGRGAEALTGASRAGLAGPGAQEAAAALDETRRALEAERATSAQLVARVKEIRDRQENLVGGLERRVTGLTAQIDAQALELQRLKAANAELADTVRALREAAGAEAGLLDRAREAEVEALRAARRAEMVEIEGLLAELRPLIGEAAHA